MYKNIIINLKKHYKIKIFIIVKLSIKYLEVLLVSYKNVLKTIFRGLDL